MATEKENLLDLLDQELPQELLDALDRHIDFANLTYPTTEEAIRQAEGKLAVQLSHLLESQFEAMSINELALRIGQKSETIKLILASSLELSYNAEASDFDILEPVSGTIYAFGENTVSLQVTSNENLLSGVSGTLTDPSSNEDSVLFSPLGDEPGVYIADVNYDEVGTWIARFQCRFQQFIITKERSFDVDDI